MHKERKSSTQAQTDKYDQTSKNDNRETGGRDKSRDKRRKQIKD